MLLHLDSVDILFHWSLLYLLRHHLLVLVILKWFLLIHYSGFVPLWSSSFYWFQVCRVLCEWPLSCQLFRDQKFLQVSRDKELCRPVPSYLLEVLLCELIVWLKLFFMLNCTCSDINKVSICVELHEGSEPVQGVRHHTRDSPNIPLQLEIVCVKYYIQLPLFSHIARVSERGELRSEWFKQLNV
jgi:hypothetical protein